MSGRRYGDLAGDGLGRVCVGDEPGDLGAPSCGSVDDPCCPGSKCASRLSCDNGSMRCQGCVKALALGAAHGCALEYDGSVWCWGKNDHGQLGDGTTDDKPAAVRVHLASDLPLPKIAQITAGANHTCGVEPGGGASWCWGDDSSGQLGHGGSNPINPVPSQTQLGPSLTVVAGAHHTCGIANSSNTVWCWGLNDVGQLGSGSIGGSVNAPVPTVDKSGQLKANALGSGETHSCAIRTDGTLWCWGSDDAGELGDGSKGSPRGPVQVPVLGTHAQKVAGGAHFSCALTDDGSVVCFGQNDRGQCGQKAGDPVVVPTTVGFDAATSVAAGGAQACARRDTGSRLQCWGNDSAPMQLGLGAGAIAVSAADRCVAGAADIQCTASNPRLSCP
jgi:alpha-tubulin suppressor-like RCC1 family protein